MATLYRRILGDAFDTLPPVLRGFHDREKGGWASGLFFVVHGEGWLCGALARLGRLSDRGTGIPVRLRVVVEGQQERWIREMGAPRFETRQWQERGLLVEAVGPFRFGYQIVAGPEGIQLRSARAWLAGLPLPAALAPRVEAVVTGQGDTWHVRVRIELPVLGLLAGYGGEVTPL